ncbi:MAG: hypothetical protein CL902_00010 [Dehalococcoidia bacterium]|nr:hypothetical protein [Dehalococcoidia bacterium]
METLTTVSDMPALLAGDLLAVSFIMFMFLASVAMMLGVPLFCAWSAGYERGQSAERESENAASARRDLARLREEMRDLKKQPLARQLNTVSLSR